MTGTTICWRCPILFQSPKKLTPSRRVGITAMSNFPASLKPEQSSMSESIDPEQKLLSP
jgi:hypothetical protein